MKAPSASKADREAAGLFLQWIIYRDLPEHRGQYVVKSFPAGDLRGRVVGIFATLEGARDLIPHGYQNTGVPDGPFMVEVWV